MQTQAEYDRETPMLRPIDQFPVPALAKGVLDSLCPHEERMRDIVGSLDEVILNDLPGFDSHAAILDFWEVHRGDIADFLKYAIMDGRLDNIPRLKYSIIRFCIAQVAKDLVIQPYGGCK